MGKLDLFIPNTNTYLKIDDDSLMYACEPSNKTSLEEANALWYFDCSRNLVDILRIFLILGDNEKAIFSRTKLTKVTDVIIWILQPDIS